MIAGAIVTIGEILVEIVAATRGHGFRDAQRLDGPFPGGAPAIFIDQVGRLGHPCAIVSAVGEDDFGRLTLDRLAADGVDVGAVAVLPGHATATAFVRFRPDGARDVLSNIGRSACGEIGATPEARRVIEDCAHLHVVGASLSTPAVADWIPDVIDTVGARGGQISFDPNIRQEIFDDPRAHHAVEAVLARTDLLLASGDDLLRLTGLDREADAVALLLDDGIPEIVLRRDAGGATHFDRAGSLDAPAFAAEEVDPTGAGNCFGAAYVVCRRRGLPVADALRYASAAGARAATIQGPMEGTASFAELDSFMAKSRVGHEPRH